MTILRIDSSISGADSVSRHLTADIADQLGGEVVHRDLVANPLTHLTERGQNPDVLAEFMAADTIVVGAPMYNFTVPSQLKAWLDRLAVAGTTFAYLPEGPKGLVGDKRVIVALASGGVYADDNPFEHNKSYLKAFFNFLGIEPEFVEALGVAISPDARTEALGKAGSQIERLAA
ncbi:FMN-dependent NADH-azoreductase [Sphingomicrobium clamense]|uniref:FMN dependent NADH:quinone oxidoreductase n=1 Tax=Sphingomicrobium clamense TaxID=2851013 RepID=A0ABS6V7W2_9SPHN|nr:NAD(P)H-dependent oxidoreductase [Sphingomicrobium sp. B8]MBW0145663.1 NAD(P)H-dependent oxidoreductase [Sphingomicrobium sp. B8]